MEQDQGPEATRTRVFKGSAYWVWNVWGSYIAGLVGIVFMQGEIHHALRFTSGLTSVPMLIVVELLIVVGFIVSWPGNMVAILPYEVILEEGKGVRLQGVLKQVYIPIEDIRDVRRNVFRGYVVRLRRRHRLLTKFVIHWLFGGEAGALVDAIQAEIRRRGV